MPQAGLPILNAEHVLKSFTYWIFKLSTKGSNKGREILNQNSTAFRNKVNNIRKNEGLFLVTTDVVTRNLVSTTRFLKYLWQFWDIINQRVNTRSRCTCLFICVPAVIYLLIVNNRNTRTRCEICLKLTIKTPERRLILLRYALRWMIYGIFGKNRKFEDFLIFLETSPIII